VDQAKQIKLVLDRWATEARLGRPADFRGWTFFETNCFSELVNQARRGNAQAVDSFLRGRDVLVLGTVLGELAEAPDIAAAGPAALRRAPTFLVADVSKFFYCDLWNFVNVDRHPRNVLDAMPLSDAILSSIGTHQPFLDAVRHSRAQLDPEFLARVAPDVGAGLDERELLPLIWSRINSLALEWLKLEIPTADARPDQFPAFFTFYYSYYFRYVKTRSVKVAVNDFNDLTNTLAAPYCRDFYTERTVAAILRNDVQGRVPPRPIEAARHLAKKGILKPDDLRRAEESQGQKSPNVGLLDNTRIWTINDLREHIASAG
jgi:hypothetical protein